MSWKEDLNAALLKFLREEMGKTDATEVTGFEEDYQPGTGNYDSLDYSTWSVDIYYRSPEHKYPLIATWEGRFSELITRLSDTEEK
jgi:hypothetical protein